MICREVSRSRVGMPSLNWLLRCSIALTATTSLMAVPAMSQEPGWLAGHLATSGRSECGMCHQTHPRGESDYALRGEVGEVRAWLAAQAPGAGPATATCLMCHWSESVRRQVPEYSDPTSKSGRYVGPHLGDDHLLGRTDAPERILRSPSAWKSVDPLESPLADRSVIECTMCHDPHDPGVKTPSAAEQFRACGACHGEEVSMLAQHSAVACTGCHTMHEAPQGALLFEATVEGTCTRCHSTTGGPLPTSLRDQSLMAAPVMVSPTHKPGSRCQDCHAVHRR